MHGIVDDVYLKHNVLYIDDILAQRCFYVIFIDDSERAKRMSLHQDDEYK